MADLILWIGEAGSTALGLIFIVVLMAALLLGET